LLSAFASRRKPAAVILLDVDEYGREKLPPKAQRTWTKAKKGDKVGFAIHPRDGTVHEIVFRMPEPEAKKGKDRSSRNDDDEASTPKKTRPEITHKGTEIIGAMRTEALVKSLEVNAVDDATLIGLLILALNARNVSIQTHGSGHATRTKLVRSITEGGRLSHDVERLRVVARQTLTNVLSCLFGHGDSGLHARIAGEAIGADAHLGPPIAMSKLFASRSDLRVDYLVFTISSLTPSDCARLIAMSTSMPSTLPEASANENGR
jgi:ParB family chromosome partitioning protein